MTAVIDKAQHDVPPGLWDALKEAARSWLAHKSPKAGASLAYYSIFSIGPLIVVVISIATLAFQREGLQREVAAAIQGGDRRQARRGSQHHADERRQAERRAVRHHHRHGDLVFAALGVVVQLKEALNIVWEVKPKRRGGVWASSATTCCRSLA